MRTANKIGYLVQHVASLLAKETEQVLQEQLHIGFSQFKILRALQTSPQMKQREIAYNLCQTEASISRQVRIMLDEGLLRTEISPLNRREHMMVFTEKGKQLTEDAMRLLASYHAPTFTALTEQQAEALAEALGVLHEQLCHQGHADPVGLALDEPT